MRQHQRRIGGKGAEYLSCLGIVEGVKTAPERLAVKRQNTRASGRFAAVQVCCVFAKDLLDIRRFQPLQNIPDRRVGGRPLPTDLERLVQPSPVRLDECVDAPVRVGSRHNRQNGKQQNIRQQIKFALSTAPVADHPEVRKEAFERLYGNLLYYGGRHRFRTFLPLESPFSSPTSNC